MGEDPLTFNTEKTIEKKVKIEQKEDLLNNCDLTIDQLFAVHFLVFGKTIRKDKKTIILKLINYFENCLK